MTRIGVIGEPHPEFNTTDFHKENKLRKARLDDAKGRQEEWWRNFSLYRIMDVLLEATWTEVNLNIEKRKEARKEKQWKTLELRSDWWGNYNVHQVLTGVQDNAWGELCLLEDISEKCLVGKL
jgi:hypothetical protein